MEDRDVALFPLPTPRTYAYSFHLYILLMWIIYHFNLIFKVYMTFSIQVLLQLSHVINFDHSSFIALLVFPVIFILSVSFSENFNPKYCITGLNLPPRPSDIFVKLLISSGRNLF